MQTEIFVEINNNGKKEPWLLTFNHRAMYTLKISSGVEPLVFLVDEAPGYERLLMLAYAASESFRRANKINISLENFVDGDYLPRYLSVEWLELAAKLDGLIVETFPEIALMRAHAIKEKSPQDQSSPNQ